MSAFNQKRTLDLSRRRLRGEVAFPRERLMSAESQMVGPDFDADRACRLVGEHFNATTGTLIGELSE